MVWVLDTQNALAHVYEARTPNLRHTARDVLLGGALLGELRIELDEVFNV